MLINAWFINCLLQLWKQLEVINNHAYNWTNFYFLLLYLFSLNKAEKCTVSMMSFVLCNGIWNEKWDCWDLGVMGPSCVYCQCLMVVGARVQHLKGTSWDNNWNWEEPGQGQSWHNFYCSQFLIWYTIGQIITHNDIFL